MIKFNLKLNGEKTPIEMPSSYDDITIAQFLQLQYDWDKVDLIQLLSILTGIDANTWSKCREADIETKLAPATFFLQKPLDLDKIPIPKTIKWKGKEHKLPKDIREKTLGQKLHMQNIISEAQQNEGELAKSIPMAIAIYMYEEFTGKDFDVYKVEDLAKQCEKLPVKIAYPIGTFFLRRSATLLGERIGAYNQNPHAKKRPPRWKSLINLVRFRR